ncbi:MAG: DNA repair protein RadC [Spirochaetota bacterium]|nr:DNA repair protein RadC [Spirochaetota bacterium]
MLTDKNSQNVFQKVNHSSNMLGQRSEVDFSVMSLRKLLSIILSGGKTSQISDLRGAKIEKLYHSLSELGKVSEDELMSRTKLTYHHAVLLKASLELGKRWVQDAEEPLIEVSSSYDVYKHLSPELKGLSKELFKVLLLNSQNQIIANLNSSKGTVSGAPVYVREVMELGLKHHAVSFIFVHNHPSGSANPSYGDKVLTRKLVLAGEIMQIPVNDHIIIGNEEYFSFLDHGLIEEYRLDAPDMSYINAD